MTSAPLVPGRPRAPSSGPPAIEAAGLTRVFGTTTAVEGLDLQVTQGEVFGLVGPDGAGKTTLVRMLAGVLDPTAGRVRIDGVDLAAEPEAVRQRLGYMPQTFALYRDLSVIENLRFFAEAYQVPPRAMADRFQRLLAFARLEPFARTLAEHLSGGMRQKLALACALLHEPELLLLDEPTTGVDPVSRREFWGLLYDLNRRGTTVLVATPYMDEADRCTRIGFMYGGRLLGVDTPAAMKAQVPCEILEVRAEPRRRALAAARALPEVRTGSIFGDALHLAVPDASTAAPRVRAALEAQGVTVAAVERATPSLEDVFIALLAGAPAQAGGRP
ncbi:MAG: ABC transporter ATP-binding protein [Armatimonadota bacterium]|nr:ABC transporter ATP-binding protein [Armatimonadota bacterium]MDR7533219.1 ABC transporter ATP-binding protein [Armatimonadota bacterium]MDR7535393.1 ABC transporter ATP-binding protein [Armatimonadota bacterium]